MYAGGEHRGDHCAVDVRSQTRSHSASPDGAHAPRRRHPAIAAPPRRRLTCRLRATGVAATSPIALLIMFGGCADRLILFPSTAADPHARHDARRGAGVRRRQAGRGLDRPLAAAPAARPSRRRTAWSSSATPPAASRWRWLHRRRVGRPAGRGLGRQLPRLRRQPRPGAAGVHPARRPRRVRRAGGARPTASRSSSSARASAPPPRCTSRPTARAPGWSSPTRRRCAT